MCGHNGSVASITSPSQAIDIYHSYDHHTMTINSQNKRSLQDCHLTVIYFPPRHGKCTSSKPSLPKQTWQPPRRCGISPYNTSHITTTRPRPESLTICKMTNPKPDRNVSDSSPATPSRRPKLSPECTSERDINMQAQTKLQCLSPLSTARYQRNTQISNRDHIPAPNVRGSLSYGVRSPVPSTAVTLGVSSKRPIFPHNGLNAIARVLERSRCNLCLPACSHAGYGSAPIACCRACIACFWYRTGCPRGRGVS
jgi:hypothetical protein